MLEKIYQLQQIEMEQLAVVEEKKKTEEYQRLKQLKAEFIAKKAQYLAMEQDFAELNEQLESFPKQIKELEGKLADEEKAIYDGSIVNARELSAREMQISTLKEKLQEITGLLALYQGEHQQKSEALEQAKQEMATIYQDFNQVKEVFSAMQERWQEDLAKLEEQKKKLVATIEDKDVQWYEAIKGKFIGTPVAYLNAEQVCSGCHTIVPPVTYKRTLEGQQTYCEKCGRILFVMEQPAKQSS